MEETRPNRAMQNIVEGMPSLRSEHLPAVHERRGKRKEVAKQVRAPRMTAREAHDAASRLVVNVRGQQFIVRFSLSQRIEHLLLIISFTVLALTGVPQRYVDTPIGGGLLQLMGGIDLARQIHHLFAMIFVLEAVYHIGSYLYNLAIYKRTGAIWPAWNDAIHLGQMLLLNLGLSKKHPRFGRFSFEEKVEYWALVWGSALMILTGIVQWFPTLVTRWLPGISIPFARTLHSWEALLAVLSILTWHMYHTVVKRFNKSIFTGYMTEEEMREEHPAELEYIERAAALVAHHDKHASMRAENSNKSNGRETDASSEALVEVPLGKNGSKGGAST
ncbi:MAG: formate dehydrogenase subunit gamma [Anaerolineales bacterium]